MKRRLKLIPISVQNSPLLKAFLKNVNNVILGCTAKSASRRLPKNANNVQF